MRFQSYDQPLHRRTGSNRREPAVRPKYSGSRQPELPVRESVVMRLEKVICIADERHDQSLVGGREQVMRGVIGWVVIGALLFGATRAHAQGDAAAGKTVFENQCASCHTTKVGQNGFGPSLAGVVGRKSGSLAGFNYSPALLS